MTFLISSFSDFSAGNRLCANGLIVSARLSRLKRGAVLAGLLAGAVSLTGCYVVPIQPPYMQNGSQHGSTV